jgi:hypothetical protein
MLARVFVSYLDGSLLKLVAVSTHVEMVVVMSNDVLAAMRRTKVKWHERGSFQL